MNYDIIKDLLPVRNQENYPMCTAFAVSTIIEYQKYIKDGIKCYMSPEFIFNKRKNKNIKGLVLEEAMEILYEYGTCKESHWKFKKKKPFFFYNKYKKRALDNKIKDYYKCSSVDMVIDSIQLYGPVAFTTPFFEQDKRLDIKKSWIGITEDEKALEEHCMLFVGYTDDDYFIVRNTWGEDFGDNGYIYFPFIDFTYISDIYVATF